MVKRLFVLMIVICFDLILVVMISEGTESEKGVAVSVNYYENMVAITFDDGPHPENTVALLDGLKERNVQATFFLLGENIEGHEDIVRRMYLDGHEIGNHTFSHVQLTKLNLEAACLEVTKTNEIIQSITGQRVEFIRPPYGSYDEQLECMIDMTPVLWTVDPMDWNTHDVDSVVNSIISNVKDGDIILLHDIYESSVAAALRVIDELKARGYVFVTVRDIIVR